MRTTRFEEWLFGFAILDLRQNFTHEVTSHQFECTICFPRFFAVLRDHCLIPLPTCLPKGIQTMKTRRLGNARLVPALLLAALSFLNVVDHHLSVVHAAAGFTQGNLVVYRVGDGSVALSSNATPVFLDEYTPGGDLVQSVALPVAANGANKRLTASGTATSEGELARSVDGRYLTATGYDAPAGMASITSSASSSVNRVIGRIDSAGAVDTTTALTDAATGSNPRGVVSTDGTSFWMDGGAGGVRFAALSSSTSVQLSSTVTNLRQITVFDGQLYVSSASGSLRLGTVGIGIPTASGQTITQLAGVPTNLSSPYGHFFTHLNPNGSGVDTLYIADDSTSAGGLLKYSLVGGSWVANGSSVGASLGVRSLTGSVQNGSVTLYVTSSSGLFTITDAAGYNAPVSGSLTSLATASTNTAFRGIAFAPLSSAPSNPSGVGAANPASAQAGSSTMLTVKVTPGANPPSSGLLVAGDLSAIGGSATQPFFDDGTHGDATAGDNVFSFQTTVDLATTAGSKTLAVTISDAQSRIGTTSMSVTILALSTPPTGIGTANPSSLQEGNTTLLTVKVTPGSSPVSTGISVAGDLHLIGGSSAQQLADDGTNGDVTPGDNIFSYHMAVASGTSPGTKSLPITVTDIQGRSSNTAISLSVQPPPPPTTVKLSQVYGGGGNSGSTYTNDFIEIFNQASTAVDLTGWSVQYNSAGTTTGLWQATSICPQGPCILAAHGYFLVQESVGAGGTTALPAADATGSIAMSATNGKVALVASTNPLSGACPTGGSLVDLVGYGTANCFETTATPALTNTTAAVRRGNGCTDTDNNVADFVTIGPIPRNSATPPNSCGEDPSRPSALGLASPSSLEPATNTLLTFKVAPALTPPSTGLAVHADLGSIGGVTLQPFYDDQSHGDQSADDKLFSFTATVAPFISTGAKTIIGTITDEEGRTEIAPITLTIQSPSCGVERWSVKVGVDPDAGTVNLGAPIRTTIADLRAIPAPATPPDNARVQPTEGTVYVVNGTMILFKKETDVDYHIVIQDDDGNTIVTEIPSPACVITSDAPRVPAPSPFAEGIANARQEFDAVLQASPVFQSVTIPVQIKGVAFFDFIHGQAGVAPNGIELHPILDIKFTNPSTTSLVSRMNPSSYGQPVVITALVSSNGAGMPTGSVGFFEGGTQLGSAPLDPNGQATFTTTSLTVGSHSFTAQYEGDSSSATSRSAAIVQVVNKAGQTISFAQLSEKTYGASPFIVSAVGGASRSPVTFAASGNCSSTGVNGAVITLVAAGTCSVTASQAGDSNYDAAPDITQSFTIKKAAAKLTITGYSGIFDAQPHGAGGSAVGVNGEDLRALLNLGVSFTDVPGGTAMWSFSGDSNYATASGTTNIVIGRATPAFKALSAPALTAGTASTTLSGQISSGLLIPTGSVTINLGGVTHNATIQPDGIFDSSFATGSLLPVNPPYVIAYVYAGDTNFNSASGAGTVTVSFGVLPLYDQTKAFKSGSTIPVKIEVSNVLGANLSSPAISVNAVRLVQISTGASSDVQEAGNANPDSNFRYDPALAPGGGYIFNLSTKGFALGTWELIFTASGDGTQHAVSFELR
jgi:hypothetical protein